MKHKTILYLVCNFSVVVFQCVTGESAGLTHSVSSSTALLRTQTVQKWPQVLQANPVQPKVC